MFNAFMGPPPPPTQGDVADWIAGSQFTFARLAHVEYSLDARKLGLDFSIPFFVIQGRDDHIAPFEVAQAYAAEVRAPRKAFIPLAGGHWACFTNPTEFVEALRRYVRPLAT
jgi:pimeloyl-ACP methyl ester carboxylesterase